MNTYATVSMPTKQIAMFFEHLDVVAEQHEIEAGLVLELREEIQDALRTVARRAMDKLPTKHFGVFADAIFALAIDMGFPTAAVEGITRLLATTYEHYRMLACINFGMSPNGDGRLVDSRKLTHGA